jgi:hypothetical protein
MQGVKPLLIETPHSREAHKKPFKKMTRSLKRNVVPAHEFRKKITEFLSTTGGLTGVAPDKGRSPVLGKPTRVVEKVTRAIPEDAQEKVLVVPVGIDIVGEDDYLKKKTRGFNFGTVYKLHYGSAHTAKDLLSKARINNTSADHIIHDRMVFESLVSDAYLDGEDRRRRYANVLFTNSQ